MDDEIYVYLVKMPSGVHEMVAPCENGYTIYIDKNLSQSGQYAAFSHAVGHIKHEDWCQIDADRIEAEAHG